MTTEAGKRLDDWAGWSPVSESGFRTVHDAIAAIEAEAQAAVLTELRAAMAKMADHFQSCGGYGCSVDRSDDWAAVIALIDERMPK